MVEIVVTAESLILEVQGTHKLWALRSKLDIPFEHIKGVHADPNPAMGWFQGLKIAGTDLPNMFRAGLFWQDGDRVFWDVRHAEKTTVIEMEDESCAKLIVEVHDPDRAVQLISQALADYRASKDEAIRELEAFIKSEGEDSIESVEESVRDRR